MGLDAERKAGKFRGPLHGIPVLIKDNIDTGDRMLTTAGLLALGGCVRAPRDAFVESRRLRMAGVVILGKTNLSEWANFRSMKSTSGWSARGGLVKKPVCAGPESMRIEFRNGAPSIAASLAAVVRRHRNRRIDRLSVRGQLHSWGSSQPSDW